MRHHTIIACGELSRFLEAQTTDRKRLAALEKREATLRRNAEKLLAEKKETQSIAFGDSLVFGNMLILEYMDRILVYKHKEPTS